jgi:uncharacterized protein
MNGRMLSTLRYDGHGYCSPAATRVIRENPMEAQGSPVNSKRPQLEALCRIHRVRRLELFGSAASSRFDSKRSDLDFLVSFETMPPEELADSYFGLLASLEDLFELPIQLVTETSASKNPYFWESVERSKSVLYGT